MKDYEFRMKVATAITKMRDRDPFFEDHPEHELARRLEKELKTIRKMAEYRATVSRALRTPVC